MATYMSKIEEYAKRPKNMVFVRSFESELYGIPKQD